MAALGLELRLYLKLVESGRIRETHLGPKTIRVPAVELERLIQSEAIA